MTSVETVGPSGAAGTSGQIAPTGLRSGRARRAVEGVLGGIRLGQLEVAAEDGTVRRYGTGEHPLAARIDVHHPRFWSRLASGGSVGLGESYVRGEWSSDDLVSLVRLLIANRPALRRVTPGAVGNTIVDRVAHALRGNRLGRARRNIVAHYDLSNDLYGLFLDETMTYSCARFEHEGQDLADAQRAKLRSVAEKARLRPGLRVLEIGCGWGSFALMAARDHGCHVTAVTLSDAQFAYVRDLVAREGLEDRIEVRLVDYRALEGTFDRIVSIEMLEAVGHRYLGTYFRAVDRLLAPDGLAVVQVITLPDQRERSYRRRPDFIQRAIFPGGHLPSLTSMARAMTRRSRLFVEDIENLGPHYAETLRHWRQRFLGRLEEVRALGFDDTFTRLWEFYLAYCEGAFLARYLNDLQLVLTRTTNATLGAFPYAGPHVGLGEADLAVAG